MSEDKKRGRGRPSLGATEAMTLRLPGDLMRRLDSALAEGEARAAFIRSAIERELRRRKLRRWPKGP